MEWKVGPHTTESTPSSGESVGENSLCWQGKLGQGETLQSDAIVPCVPGITMQWHGVSHYSGSETAKA